MIVTLNKPYFKSCAIKLFNTLELILAINILKRNQLENQYFKALYRQFFRHHNQKCL